jgi:hypothetical protein
MAQKHLPLFLFALFAFASSCFAQTTGIYGLAIEIDATGTGASMAGLTLYGVDPTISGTDPRYLPDNSVATQSGAWTSTSNDSNVTFNLGTFDPDNGDTLTLAGGSMLTFESGGGTVDTTDAGAQSLHYSIVALGSPDFFVNGIDFAVDNTNPSGNNNGDIRFATEDADINMLAGRTPGTYMASFYGFSAASTGDNYDNDGGLNYTAYFTIIPEPQTWTLLAAGAAILFFARRRLSLR